MTLNEAKKIFEIIKISANKIDMVAPILDMVDETPEIQIPIETGKEEKVSVRNAAKEKREYHFKPKQCSICGNEFTPHYGAQKICDTCKDIQDTAKDIVSEIED